METYLFKSLSIGVECFFRHGVVISELGYKSHMGIFQVVSVSPTISESNVLKNGLLQGGSCSKCRVGAENEVCLWSWQNDAVETRSKLGKAGATSAFSSREKGSYSVSEVVQSFENSPKVGADALLNIIRHDIRTWSISKTF
jgi:hypothetical protein